MQQWAALTESAGFSAEEPESGDEGAFLSDHTVKVSLEEPPDILVAPSIQSCADGTRGGSPYILRHLQRFVRKVFSHIHDTTVNFWNSVSTSSFKES